MDLRLRPSRYRSKASPGRKGGRWRHSPILNPGEEPEDLARGRSRLVHHAEVGITNGEKPAPLGGIPHALDGRDHILVARPREAQVSARYQR